MVEADESNGAFRFSIQVHHIDDEVVEPHSSGTCLLRLCLYAVIIMILLSQCCYGSSKPEK